jgi:putative isomerase
MFAIDLPTQGFSCAGSFIRLCTRDGRLAIVTARRKPFLEGWFSRDTSANDLFTVDLVHGNDQTVPCAIRADAEAVILSAAGATVSIAFADPETLAITGEGAELVLGAMQTPAWVDLRSERDLIASFFSGRCQPHIRADVGARIALSVQQREDLTRGSPLHRFQARIGGSGRWHAAVRLSEVIDVWDAPLTGADAARVAVRQQLAGWMARAPRVVDHWQEMVDRAWFILWHARVVAGGGYRRPAVLMSKSTMNQVWSWDNCFTALALSRGDGELAWNQVLIPFDHQAANGQLPDTTNDDTTQFAFTKPPIYGWAVRQLVERFGAERSQAWLRQLYRPLCRFTDFWRVHRRRPGDDLSYYYHGNDSGWDNSTAFDQGFPTLGVDLAAFLVLQCDCLAVIAEILDEADAEMWRGRAEQELAALLARCTQGNRFVSPLLATGRAEPTRSLVPWVAVMLGRRVPERFVVAACHELRPDGPFLTPHGLATESLDSPKHLIDGYWRGPIWAPPTHLICAGLREAGRPLWRTIAERFCALCARDNLFWENYDPHTGQGLRSPAYTWTAATAIELACWLSEEE